MNPDKIRLIIMYRAMGETGFPCTGFREQLSWSDITIRNLPDAGSIIAPRAIRLNENDEAFVLRLLRRVRESHDEPQGPSLVIHADEIEFRIYRDDGSFYINPITESGDFALPWPEPDGFFGWRAKELF